MGVGSTLGIDKDYNEEDNDYPCPFSFFNPTYFCQNGSEENKRAVNKVAIAVDCNYYDENYFKFNISFYAIVPREIGEGKDTHDNKVDSTFFKVKSIVFLSISCVHE